MEKCARCRVSETEVRLFDAVYDGRIGLICERCAIIENIPIIKKPGISQLKESERSLRVHDRMRALSGIRETKKGEIYFIEDKLKELEKNPELELPEREKLNLVDHFHWEIMRNRRRKGLSQKKLAEAVGESEIAIDMIEKGKYPENAESIIRKLEQFFQVRLRNISEREKFIMERKRSEKPVLLNAYGEELDQIPEEKLPEIEKDEEEDDEEVPEVAVDDQGDLDLKKTDSGRVRIKDLMSLHRKKIEATKQERIEEQKKIEERQRMIEARKEEMRLRREKESKELDRVLGGSELLGKDNKRYSREIVEDEEFDEDD